MDIRLLIFILCGAQSIEFNSNCCKENWYLSSSKCIRPDKNEEEGVQLNCTSGMYILDPNEEPGDTFSEDKSTGILQLDQFDSPVEPGTWCIVRKEDSPKPVALVCFTEEELEQGEPPKVVEHVYGVLMLVSSAFLFATLVVYALLPELRDLQGKCLMANVLSLALGFLPLALIQFYGSTISQVLCVMKAFFLYFWLLSSFFWLNVVSFNVWCSVLLQGRVHVQENFLFYIFCGYAWGIPGLFLTAALITQFAPNDLQLLRPYFGHSRCWFHGPEETWAYFYGPVAILITINLLLFASTAFSLWRGETDGTSARIRSHRFKCILYLKLFVVMGLSWVFEVVSYAVGEMNWFWYMTDALNCLQGVLIFFILVCRKRTMRAISSRKWGSVLCPKYKLFGDGTDDEEDSAAMLQEELELSRPAA